MNGSDYNLQSQILKMWFRNGGVFLRRKPFLLLPFNFGNVACPRLPRLAVGGELAEGEGAILGNK